MIPESGFGHNKNLNYMALALFRNGGKKKLKGPIGDFKSGRNGRTLLLEVRKTGFFYVILKFKVWYLLVQPLY